MADEKKPRPWWHKDVEEDVLTEAFRDRVLNASLMLLAGKADDVIEAKHGHFVLKYARRRVGLKPEKKK